MKNRTVKDVMVPISEYATVSETASLMDAVNALETVQAKFDPSRYRHRAILVLNESGGVVGKIGQIDIIRALEPKYDELPGNEGLAHLGFTKKFIRSMLSSYNLWETPMADICRKGAERRVRDFMSAPTEGEYVEADASLDVGIHLLVTQRRQSLLVTGDSGVVGILRLTDVYTEVVNAMKTCRL